jgi:hypothetical protein
VTGPHRLTDVGSQRGWWHYEAMARQCWADASDNYRRQCQAYEVDDTGLCAWHRRELLGR